MTFLIPPVRTPTVWERLVRRITGRYPWSYKRAELMRAMERDRHEHAQRLAP